MEGIILLIVSLLISTIFGKKKQNQNPTKVPKQGNKGPEIKPFVENPFKNLGELAKEFKQEQQAKIERRPTVPKQEPIQPVTVEKVQREVSREQGAQRSSGRLSVHQGNRPVVPTAKPVVASVLPETKDELVRAIILSEILAPPKSKR
ncbi:hypothetical protein [Psychrobacillus lasiicapitis]|uniref:Uncharacterized protein n=1 Tax=Psychrobacillus lasiicapitis TaxID=1636719 RepID=A0A544TA29_9BACI|nr:hypothetical protein [Psychrobacillus lasiicapitis]TQR14300.1 hypothetical protein FG382_07525 [Psychrobacillus lasiicapitis]GGA32489.1 hypothetical protein GCM10011384_22640 [Psychrobacillus lasiicapitis]